MGIQISLLQRNFKIERVGLARAIIKNYFTVFKKVSGHLHLPIWLFRKIPGNALKVSSTKTKLRLATSVSQALLVCNKIASLDEDQLLSSKPHIKYNMKRLIIVFLHCKILGRELKKHYCTTRPRRAEGEICRIRNL